MRRTLDTIRRPLPAAEFHRLEELTRIMAAGEAARKERNLIWSRLQRAGHGLAGIAAASDTTVQNVQLTLKRYGGDVVLAETFCGRCGISSTRIVIEDGLCKDCG